MPGLLEFIGTIFGSDPSAAIRAVEHAWLDKLEADEQTARAAAQRLLDWYWDDKLKIEEHVTETAKKTFDPETLAEWQFVKLNGVRRVISRLSTAYLEAPERILVNAEGTELPKENPAYTAYEAMFKGMDMDKKFKLFDRMSTLFNTIHVEVVPRGNAIDWDMRLRPISFVVPNPADEFQPERFAYEWNVVNPKDLAVREGWVLWSADNHVWIGAGGQEVGLSLEEKGNPYDGVMPIVVIRREEQDDYWGQYAADVVDAFEQLTVQLGNLWENAIMQAHAQPFGINLNLPEGSKLRAGPKHPIMVDGVDKSKIEPRLDFVKPETDLDSVVAMLQWFLQASASAKGMPASAWAQEEKNLSGFAKLIDNLELLEIRTEDLPQWVGYEEALFAKSVMVWNRWDEVRDGAPAMPDGVGLKVVTKEVSFPEDPLEKATRQQMEIKMGILTAAHVIAERDGIPLEEAIEEAKNIAQIQKDIRSAGGPAVGEDGLPVIPGQAEAPPGEPGKDEPKEGAPGD